MKQVSVSQARKKFNKFRDRNPNDPISQQFKLLKQGQKQPGSAEYQKSLKRWDDIHERTSFSKQHVERTVERDEVVKEEEKLTWPKILKYYELKNCKTSYETLVSYEKMGWVRTVGIQKQNRRDEYSSPTPTAAPHPTPDRPPRAIGQTLGHILPRRSIDIRDRLSANSAYIGSSRAARPKSRRQLNKGSKLTLPTIITS